MRMNLSLILYIVDTSVKYFEKGDNVKRVLLMKAHGDACAQGERDAER